MGTKLGQNFLKHPEIAAKITMAAKLTPQDTVLEVGPGRGILTAELLAHAARVIAIEKDEKLADYLAGKFATELVAKKLILVRSDILDFIQGGTLTGIIHSLSTVQGGTLDKYKVVANIPYYITGQLIRKFLEAKNQPTSMTLLVQKEVAERIVAKPPHINLLALSVQCYGAPRVAFKVGRGSFSPPPNVDSAVITIENISRDFFRRHKIAETEFFALLHAGFAQKRKMLVGNIAALAGGKEYAVQLLTRCGIALNARAENLSLEQWAIFTKTVKSTLNN